MRVAWVAGAVAAVVMLTVLLIVAVLAIATAKDEANNAAREQARTSLVLIRSCQDNGNPLRMAVQQMLRDQIRQSKSLDLGRFFPNVPPKVLHRLIREQNERRRDLIKQIQPVNCAALYD